jgi:hypothetical protein
MALPRYGLSAPSSPHRKGWPVRLVALILVHLTLRVHSAAVRTGAADRKSLEEFPRCEYVFRRQQRGFRTYSSPSKRLFKSSIFLLGACSAKGGRNVGC